MSNAPYSPPPAPSEVEPAAPDPIDYGAVQDTGVRKVLDAFEERDLARVRWSGVLAGLFLAVGAEMLLGLLGAAVGISAIDPRSAAPFDGAGTGGGVWMAVTSIIALFIGGYAAAKLGGSLRRADGVLAGVLTWATSLVLAMWLFGSVAGAAAHRLEAIAPRVEANGQGARARAAGELLANQGEAGRAAWGAFGCVVLALVAAGIGGAAGAAGGRTRRTSQPMRGSEVDAWRRARERDREAMAREAAPPG